MKRSDITKLGAMVDSAQSILLLQPDKPDGDSLASMLALEEIFGQMGKTVMMYCAGRVEAYLNHIPGWDRVRVADDWPSEAWDLAILVDTAAPDQIARLLGPHHAELNRKPWAMLDHHISSTPIEGVALFVVDPEAAATGELIYQIAKTLKWSLSSDACSRLVASLYADTLNLTTQSVTTKTVETFAALVKQGNLNVSELHAAYREASATDADLLPVKGELLQRLELFADGRIAIITVPEELTKAYRERRSLTSLVMFEVLWARGVQVAAVMNDYGTIIRTSLRGRLPIVGKVAEELGGGGHDRASAFAVEGETLDTVKTRLVEGLTHELDTYGD